MLSEMQSVSSRIWTRVAMSIFYDDNHYTTGRLGIIYDHFGIQVSFFGIFIRFKVQVSCFPHFDFYKNHLLL